jgi:RNA polymerase sigma-70 factor (ECF subfamily)
LANFESIYHQFFPKIYNYIFYRLLDRDQTDDLVSVIFLRIYEKLATYDESRAKLSTWIFTIARNAYIDNLRRMKETVSLDDGESGLNLPSGDDVQLEWIKSEERKALYIQLAKLSEREREIIALKYFTDMTNLKIAQELSISETNVSSVVYNAMKKLRLGMREYSVEMGEPS